MKVVFLFLLIFFNCNFVFSEDCNPQPKTKFKKKGHFILSGKPANFNHCHHSVDFKLGFGSDRSQKWPLMIGVGGGGGKIDAMRAMFFFRKNGFATLEFDAYEMNGISDYRANKMFYGNATRQEMIFPIAVGAVKWAKKQKNIDTSRIYIWGVSNGATVVANIAAVFNKKQIKSVFAEAPTNVGMGMPDEPKVPLVLIFGKKDNYGSIKKDGWRWLDKTLCRKNIYIKSAPKGNTFRCNKFKNKNLLTESHQSWFQKQKKKNKDIQMWFYEDAAHGIFARKFNLNSFVTNPRTNQKWYTSSGSADYIKEKYKKDLLQYILNSR